MRNMRLIAMAVAAASCVGGASARAGEVRIDLDRPGEGEFVRDLADMIDPADEDRIRAIGQKLLADKAAPLLVVTIPSMERHLSGGGDGMRIELFAQMLFDQWGVGPWEVAGHPWNRGMLLLVSRGDRAARIELGGGWGFAKNGATQAIMDEQIVPRLRAGDYSAGIAAGVEGLDAMARELALPGKPVNWKPIAWVTMAGLVGVLVIVSLYRSGARGWAGTTGRVAFEMLSSLQDTSTRTGRRSRSWGGGVGGGFRIGGSFGGFSGRSSSGRSSFSGSSRTFGGGRSGGGGASGRW